MNTYQRTQCACMVGLAVLLTPAFACAGDSEALGMGALRGVALNAAGQPVATVSIAIHSIGDGTNRTVVSDPEGAFAVDGLKPGPYQISASKEGIGSSPTMTVEVAQNQTARPYLVLAAKSGPPAAPLTMEQELQAMKDRIAVLEAELKARPAAPATPAVATASEGELKVREAPAADSAAVAAAAEPRPEQSAAAGPPPAPAPPPQAAPAPHVPEALEPPDATTGVDNFTPFAYGDFTWLNGSPRNKDTVLDTKFFTPEIRFDTHYMEDFNQPIDHTIVGATESFRSGEVQMEQISVGGDFHWQNVRGRVLFMFGLFATTTPRNDASFAIGQWDLRDAYKYISEAYGGYHFNVNHGLNVDAGIFVSYIGLFSYYNFDNWTYQPSYVSSNTPWFFNGVRVQWFPTQQAENRTLVHQRMAVLRQVQRPSGPGRTASVGAERMVQAGGEPVRLRTG